MSDRELLEAAARAAGYTIDKIHQAWRDSLEEGSAGLWLTDGTRCWNPLTDDGDALRLAVKLNMQIVITGYELEGVGITDCKAGLGKWAGGSLHHSDPCAATRRAIVRAAAAIGGHHG